MALSTFYYINLKYTTDDFNVDQSSLYYTQLFVIVLLSVLKFCYFCYTEMLIKTRQNFKYTKYMYLSSTSKYKVKLSLC
jgi:hypothetical protein